MLTNWFYQGQRWGRSTWRSFSKWLTLSHDLLHFLRLLVRLSMLSSLLTEVERTWTWSFYHHSTLSNMPVWDSSVFQSSWHFVPFYLHASTPALGIFFHLSKALFVILFLLYHVIELMKFSFPFSLFFIRPIIPKVLKDLNIVCEVSVILLYKGYLKKYKNQSTIAKTNHLNFYFSVWTQLVLDTYMALPQLIPS